MAEPRWKAMERRKCRDLGGQRRPSIGPHGWAQGSDDDGTLPVSLECKYVTRYQLRRAWVEQARRSGKADGRPWTIAIEEHGDRFGGLAVVPWPYYVALEYGTGHIPLAASGGSGVLAIRSRQSIWTPTSPGF